MNSIFISIFVHFKMQVNIIQFVSFDRLLFYSLVLIINMDCLIVIKYLYLYLYLGMMSYFGLCLWIVDGWIYWNFILGMRSFSIFLCYFF
jgi:hypothetical protein